ncbi:MAG: carbamoyltransferase HypF [Bdellovibrionales bacterium GWA1_52_35]|nr:MAG: carbamoyltransferase HypF [Bdellovibrionales bacterium GWA1_52_35]HCM38389.1 carbamoyltransferase HypF [Bdellovibrionales bacterium]
MASHERKRLRVEISGTVQGVGFRPFVYRLAQKASLVGFVFNHDQGVTAEVEGSSAALERFVADIRVYAPPAAHISSLDAQEIPLVLDQESVFSIRPSGQTSSEKFVAISPDLALCEECRSEIWNPHNRRYFYPFTNCTNCGPRFSIIRDVPYDRPLTTMAQFEMCVDCQAEYDDPADRRFHAQPNACARCGPQLSFSEIPAERDSRKLIQAAAALLRSGQILALKGIGGFHLACDALNENAVQKLRQRKTREFKPFAVMFGTLDAARRYVELSSGDEQALRTPAAPIVLARKRASADTSALSVAASVAPENHELGVLLPYSPLHELLLNVFEGPLVMTSGNRSDEPICQTNEQALKILKDIADGFLLHDREIHVRCDDSVLRGETVFRRSRGFAPQAVASPEAFSSSILGVGAELKNTFCLSRAGRRDMLLSHHIGDLENLSTLESFENGIDHFKKIFGIEPAWIAHDLHPDYLNTKWALQQTQKLIGVQHHHAHTVACMLENGSLEPVIGLALDGTGFGTDGAIWGGELLVADARDFLRVGHLKRVQLPAGNAALKRPWMLAQAYLKEVFPASDCNKEFAELTCFSAVQQSDRVLLSQLLDKKLRTYPSSSCGRLFDAVSALTGIVREVHYEGQAAIELERALQTGAADRSGDRSGAKAYVFEIGVPELKRPAEIDWRPILQDIVNDLRSGTAPALISWKFHEGLVRAFADLTAQISTLYHISTVALSGGCFLNEFLRRRLTNELRQRGLKVLVPRALSPGDGSIALGQVIVADQIVKGKSSCVWQYQ